MELLNYLSYILYKILSNITAQILDNIVATIHGKTISVGFVLLYNILRAIIVVGTKVTPAVFITKKVIILLEAVSFLSFNSCKDFIAFKPNGVAADPRPKIFIIIFDAM